MENVKPQDLLALTMIIIVMILTIFGKGAEFHAMITLIVGYYFGRRDERQIVLHPDATLHDSKEAK